MLPMAVSGYNCMPLDAPPIGGYPKYLMSQNHYAGSLAAPQPTHPGFEYGHPECHYPFYAYPSSREVANFFRRRENQEARTGSYFDRNSDYDSFQLPTEAKDPHRPFFSFPSAGDADDGKSHPSDQGVNAPIKPRTTVMVARPNFKSKDYERWKESEKEGANPPLVNREGSGVMVAPPLKKRRNNERRKEKSRDAARCRRGKESEIFAELGALLPLESPLSATLDKASVIRVAIAYLRTRSLVTWGLDIPSSEIVGWFSDAALRGLLPEKGKGTPAEAILGALDGFLIVLTKEAEIVYTSENISTFLGLSQIDVIGHSLLDYTHPCDHDEVKHLVTLVKGGPNNTFLRFKCTLTPKGRNVNLKSATYKVVRVTGQVLNAKKALVPLTEALPSRNSGSWIVALGMPVPHPSNIEVPLDKQTFVSKHSLDMKFTYVDENVKEFCGYQPEDLLGRSLYQVNHALDTHLVKEAYKTLRSKGQVETGRYRFLSHGGGYVWVMTQATLITGHRDNKPQYVVCLNYVISQIESRDVIFSDCQLKTVTGCTPPAVSLPLCIPPVQQSAAVSPPVPTAVPSSVPSVSRPSKLSPVAATCSLLRDRTEDMNEGYLTFADNDSYVTILKEEPEDLTHLAPSVGEGCVPLEVSTFLHGLDNFLETSSDFDLAKPQRSSSFDLKETVVDESIESLLNNPALTPQSSEEQARKTHVPSKGTRPPFVPPVPLRPGQERRKQRVEELIQKDFRFSPKQTSSHPCHKVPDQEVTSPSSGGGSPGKRFDTPEPPQSPLLSQAASPLTPERGVNVSFLSIGSKPIPTTTRLFTSLHEENSPTSTMDLFNSLDLKLEDDLDPPINEMLAFDQDDLFSLPNPSDHQECRGDETTFGSKQKVGEAMNKFVPPNFGYFSPQHSFQQVKMGADTGGNFVDPNQVLPGQFYIKGEEKDNLQELRYLLEAPPPSPVKEAVDPPPPLKGSTSPFSYHSDKIGVKRASSPVHSIPIKRFRPTICLTTPSTIQKRELSSDRPSTANQSRDLPTPNAPLMQQLLSNEDSSLSPDSPLHPLHSFPLNKEGKVELTRQQLTALLDRAGVLRPSFRVVEGGGATPPTPREVSSPSYFSPATPAGEFAKEKQSLLVMDSNLASIPTLFDLTSFDCEVNAPAPDPSLLQGSELLMALEQTQ